MAQLKEIPSFNDALKQEMSSWDSLPLGYFLQIKNLGEAPASTSEFFLLIDDYGNCLLVE